MKVPVDNQPPSMPSSLSAQAVSSAQINLSWVGSTDNDRVSGYKIDRNNKCIGISHTAAFSELELEPDTAYVYAVQAFDSYGNTSGKTSNVSIKTGILNNARPQIQDQSVSVVEDGEIDINLQAFDGENDPLTYHIVSFLNTDICMGCMPMERFPWSGTYLRLIMMGKTRLPIEFMIHTATQRLLL